MRLTATLPKAIWTDDLFLRALAEQVVEENDGGDG
jgi:hypothetical protein